jgi:IclR family pca regulon transcriptional regulator
VLETNLFDRDRVEIKAFTPRTVTAPGRLRKLIRQAGQHNSAVVDQELAVSLRSLAVPVKNRQGKALCAINIGMPVDMMETGEAVSQFLPILQKAAQNAEQLIAHLPG